MARKLRVWGVLGVALVLAGCGGGGQAAEDETTPASEAAPASSEVEPAASEATEAAPAGAATVAVADSALGAVLVDAEGRTLYLFENDGGSQSTCYDDCASNWPALATDGEPEAGDGADAALLGTTEREDGTMQVTYADSPLYYFAGDAAAGEVTGQGVGDVWYVVGADGSAVTTPAG